MKQKTPLSLGAICAVFANCVMATEWNVSTVAALTNAVTQAMPGDKIILAQGKYTFTDEWMENDGTGKCLLVVTNDNITIEGAVATPRATWTDHDEPVIIDGAGLGAIVKVDQSNKSPQWQVRNRLTIRHLTFTGSSYRGVAFANGVTSAQYDFIKCTNCVFRQNSWTAASSTTYMFNWGEMRDCLVTNNIVGTGGNALLGSMVVYGSDIVGNATAGTSVMRSVTAYDCTVRGNNAANVVQGVDSDTPKVYSNCTFSANTTTSDLSIYGEKFIDCDFLDNTANGHIVNSPSNEGRWFASCSGCRFTRNTVTKGVVRNPTAASLSGCWFVENRATDVPGSAVYLDKIGSISLRVEDCRFVGNYAASSSMDRRGGAINMKRTATCLLDIVVTNCLFECNTNLAVSGAIYNNDAALPAGEAAWEHFLVQDCVFRANRAGYSAGVYGVHAVGCTFDGNVKTAVNDYNRSGNAAARSFLRSCDINDAELSDCIVDRCRIHHVTNACYIFTGLTAVTNTLVEHCAPSVVDMAALLRPTSSYYDASNTTLFSASFVNCTFVTNRFATYSSDRADYSATNGISFVNCLFNGNQSARLNYSAWRDTDFHVIAGNGNPNNIDYPDMIDYVTFNNSYYGKFYAFKSLNAAKFAAWTNAPNALALCENPGFVKDSMPNAPYWSLSIRSPLRGAGDLLDYTDSNLDLAGRPRIRDGKVDIGCYQCWLREPGFMMIVR